MFLKKSFYIKNNIDNTNIKNLNILILMKQINKLLLKGYVQYH